MWMIMFYANDNKESRQVSSKFENLASQPSLAYKVGAVDCRLSDREGKFCAEKKIDTKSGLPSFGLVVDGELIMYNGYDRNKSTSPMDFHNFCLEHMPKQYIQNINAVPQIDERLLSPKKKKNTTTPAVLLLTDKYETSSMFYSLAYYFRTDFILGESRAKNLKLAQTFNVKKYPTLIAFVPSSISGSLNAKSEKYNDKYDIIRYSGQLKKDKITSWLTKLKSSVENAEARYNNKKSSGRRTTRTEF